MGLFFTPYYLVRSLTRGGRRGLPRATNPVPTRKLLPVGRPLAVSVGSFAVAATLPPSVLTAICVFVTMISGVWAFARFCRICLDHKTAGPPPTPTREPPIPPKHQGPNDRPFPWRPYS